MQMNILPKVMKNRKIYINLSDSIVCVLIKDGGIIWRIKRR